MSFKMWIVSTAVLSYLLYAVSAHEYKRVCYYSNWSQYRPGKGKFFPTDIEPGLCTHLIYSFAKLDENYELATFEWNDLTLYEQFNGLKQGTNIKTLIAVGGWNAGSERFSNMVSRRRLRKKFARKSVDFVVQHGFDGLDMDWEYPGNRGGMPSDKANFITLLKDIRKAMKDAGQGHLLLTAAVAAGQSTIDSAYDIPGMAENLDFINLMSYDLHGAWENFTGHNSPLYSRSSENKTQAKLNVDWAARYWVEKGALPSQLIIGLATYGRHFTLRDQSQFYIGAPTSEAGKPGPMTKEAGLLAYYEICTMLNSSATNWFWHNEHMVPYLVLGDQWVGYDDEASFRIKLQYIMDNSYGGAMIWNIDLDDFNKSCPQSRRKYPLVNLLKEVFEGNEYYTENYDWNVETTTLYNTGSGNNVPTQGNMDTEWPFDGEFQNDVTPDWIMDTVTPLNTEWPFGDEFHNDVTPDWIMDTVTPFDNNWPFDDEFEDDVTPDWIMDTVTPFDSKWPFGDEFENDVTPDWNKKTEKPTTESTDWNVETESPINNEWQTSVNHGGNVRTTTPYNMGLEKDVTPDWLMDTVTPFDNNWPFGDEFEDDVTPDWIMDTVTPFDSKWPFGDEFENDVTLDWNKETEKPTTESTDWGVETVTRIITDRITTTTEIPTEPFTTTVSSTKPTTTKRTTDNKNFCQNRASGLYRKRDDCQSFYQCAHGRTFIKQCGSGTVFNPSTKNCDWPHNVNCNEGESIEEEDVRPVDFCALYGDGFHSNPDDCHKFIRCVNGVKFDFSCGTLAFNPNINTCDWPYNVDC